MTVDLPEDNILAARIITRACRKTALATVDKDGAPYVSLVTLALDHDLSPILIISSMSAHTRNIENDPRVGYLFDGTHEYPNPQSGPRLSLQGVAAKITDTKETDRLRQRFLARNPGAAGYASFGDFSLWKTTPSRGQFVGGFGRAVWIDAPFGLDPSVVSAFKEGEVKALEHLHAKGLTQVVSFDPDGYDIATGDSWSRMDFGGTVNSIDQAIAFIEKNAMV